MVTDHIDGNPLNNQKSNLRICTRSQNQWNKGMSKNNKSGYKGVKICGDKFTAQIVINRKVKHLGQFDSNKDAATAYNNAAQKYFGEYAKLNQIGV